MSKAHSLYCFPKPLMPHAESLPGSWSYQGLALVGMCDTFGHRTNVACRPIQLPLGHFSDFPLASLIPG